MKIRLLDRYVDADLASRIVALRAACADVETQAPCGLTQREATAIVRRWKPAFGDLRMEKDGAFWAAVVYHYCCAGCKEPFDERDMPMGTDRKDVCCPKCGTRVAAHDVKPPPPPAATVASRSLGVLEAVERAKIRAAKGGE